MGSPSNAVQRLQKKLIQLSLEIEDKAQAIDILRDAINEQDTAGVALQTDEHARRRSEFQRNTTRHKLEQTKVLDACNAALSAKKGAAATVERLLRSKKEEETITARALDAVRAESQRAHDLAHSEWRAGEEARRREWMAQKVKKMRDLTVKALEPEVERIVQQHKAELANIAAEGEAKKNHLVAETDALYDDNVQDYQRDADNRYMRAIGDAQGKWGNKTAEAHEDHVIQVAQLRDKLFMEGESQRRRQADDARMVADRHAEELAKVRADAADRIKDAQAKWAKERDMVKQRAEAERDAIASACRDGKSAWEAETTRELEKAREKLLKVKQSELQQSRDVEIDKLIRKAQEEECQHEESCRDDTDDRIEAVRAARSEEIKRIEKVACQYHDKISSSALTIERLAKESNDLKGKVRRAEGEAVALESKIAEIQTIHAEKVRKTDALLEQIRCDEELTARNHSERKQILEDRLRTMHEKHSVDMHLHREKIDALKGGHQNELDILETKVRHDIESKDKAREALLDQIKDETIRIEHTRTILRRHTKSNCSKTSLPSTSRSDPMKVEALRHKKRGRRPRNGRVGAKIEN